MVNKLLNNWGLKLISLFLAFLLWFLVVQIGDPKDDQDMGNVHVRLVNTELLDQENKVYEILDGTDTVRVTVYAPKSVFTQLRNSDITAEADISKLTDINTVPIDFSTTAANVVSITGSHDSVKLSIEEKASKYVPLISKTVGEVAEGYVALGVTPDQNRIEVSGPKSAVEQIKSAGAQLDVTDATSNLSANVDIMLYDLEGNEVEQTRITKNVNHVKISVEILAVKEVPILFAASGTPETGYMVAGDVTCDTGTVKVAGSLYALSSVSAITIPEEVLDLTGVTEDLVKTVDIRAYLPDNTKLGDPAFNGRVTLTVPIEAVMERTILIPMDNITIANVPEELEAEFSETETASVPLEVAGLSELVNTLSRDSILGRADIGAWMQGQGIEKLKAGNYTVPVTFQLDEEITVKNETTVKITLKEKEK